MKGVQTVTHTLKIATWNINSIRSRLTHVAYWLEHAQPDVLCLQEIKCLTSQFPFDLFHDYGYDVACLGQKSYNGVAIASKRPLSDVTFGFEAERHHIHRHNTHCADISIDTSPEGAARYVEAMVTLSPETTLRIGCAYIPNGNPIDSEKYPKKKAWLKQMTDHIHPFTLAIMPYFLLGDFNIIPRAQDAAHPSAWVDDALFTPEVRDSYFTLLHAGYTDILEMFTPTPSYTFWDYQARSFERNNGIRIDHILANPTGTNLIHAAGVDKDMRAREKPSDHVPVWVEICA